MPRTDFSFRGPWFSFQQTEMAMKATWINQWLDEGELVLGLLEREGSTYLAIKECVKPNKDSIQCLMWNDEEREIFGYQRIGKDKSHEPSSPP